MACRTLDWVNAWNKPWDCADDVTDLKKAGGFDKRAMMYGDWSWLGAAQAYYRFGYNRVVLSHYAYRGLPTATIGGTGTHAIYPDLVDQEFRIHFTKPDRKVYPGEPIFKTQKQLAGRAIVSDSWGRSPYNADPAQGSGVEPGEGFYGHRDGYNILYGDWHAKWYGDAQGELTWWTPRYFVGTELFDWTTRPDYYEVYNLFANYLSDARASYRGVQHNFICHGPIYLWHQFDASSGIDVGVDSDDMTW